ncbi:hypothetical protein CONCODRAFT_170283 [Conidiobolus coronatus NRRL 28638]|uniref:F-box domain-containing protein n=1 Tax=Conidiobolus coronatus (strain ATCC 28846 / CBS 209.66 / NRRL 28638) TaxID=796925 RepID=A0A137NQ61_CONC2|nr:hypothetical protein CONCODRAFT_170283 [Conidiobolus coronatus NRRL 28638]|eukprot:KXN64834.1 hypothetical protein CONCODRAFT_170283 [Conidiobolus coronatus NRRL 28638]
MEKLDNKQKLNLLCSPDLLQYLPNNDKSELLQCSKYTLSKCTPNRLSKLDLYHYRLYEMSTIFNSSKLTSQEILQNQLTHIDPVIAKYKTNIIRLGIGWNYNYNLVKYSTQSFVNLTKLYLVSIIIPKFEFNNILFNLNNLDTLWLDEFILGFSNIDEDTLLDFPSLLKNLNWASCKQTYYDSSMDLDPVVLHDSLSEINFDSLDPLEIPTNSIKNLKFLTSYNAELQYTRTINQLIQTNPKLIQLSTLIQTLDNTTIKLISRSANLEKLHFYIDYGDSDVQVTDFLPMPYLKSIEFNIVPIHRLVYTNQLVNSCKNLINLKYPWFPETESDLHGLITNLEHLEYLTLHNCSNSPNFISFKLSNKNLKTLEFIAFDPLKIDFELFSNLKNLKRVKLTIYSQFHRYLTEIRDYYENLIGWRVFFHKYIIQCWKVC